MFENYSPPKTLREYAELERRINRIALQDPKMAIEVRRDLCKKDLFYLGRYVSLLRFGLKVLPALDGSGRPEKRCPLDSPVAIEVARILENMGNRSLFIGGRGMLKSTFYILRLIQLIIIDPDVRILVVCSKKYLAERRLRKLIEEIDKNRYLRELFPDVFWETLERKRAKVPWSEKSLVVKRTGTYLEGTVDSAGALDSLPISVHYNFIMGDDMEEPSNVTDATLPQLIESLEHIAPLLAGEGSVFNTIGTYHHPQGLHAVALPEAGWTEFILPAVDRSNIPEGYVDIPFKGGSKAVWHHEIGGVPRYDTPTYLAEQFLTMKPDAYQTQFWCVKPGEVNRALDPDRLQWYLAPGYVSTIRDMGHYHLDMKLLSQCELVLLVDPAHSKGAGADATAMLMVGLWQNGTTRMVIVLDGYLSPYLRRAGRLAVATALIRKWGPAQVRWESFSQVEDDKELDEQLPTAGIRNVQVVGYTNFMPKPVRTVETIQPWLVNGELWVPRGLAINNFPAPDTTLGIPFCSEVDVSQELMKEMNGFPGSNKNHLLDCLSMCNEASSKKGKIAKRRPPLRWGGPLAKVQRARFDAVIPADYRFDYPRLLC